MVWKVYYRVRTILHKNVKVIDLKYKNNIQRSQASQIKNRKLTEYFSIKKIGEIRFKISN